MSPPASDHNSKALDTPPWGMRPWRRGGGTCGIRRLMRGREGILRRVLAAFPRTPPDVAESAFADTVLELHQAADPPDALTAPWAVVYARCWRRLRAVVRSERARREREARWVAEHQAPVSLPDDLAGKRAALGADLVGRVRGLLPDSRMRITFDLWLEGERDTQVYARAFGITATSVAERRREVKRERDRLRVFLRRLVHRRKLEDDSWGQNGIGHVAD